MGKLLLKGGRLLDPAAGVDRVADLLVAGTVIAAIGEDLSDPSARVVDCTGCVVAPGFIDLHAHLREPGEEWKEDIASGTRAAARGGFVAVCAMPDTDPPADRAPLVRYLADKAAREAVVKVWPYGTVTKGRRGEELAEMGEMAEAGAVGFTDAPAPVDRAEVMRLALLYAAQFGLPVLDRPEDRSISQGGVMHYGRFSTVAGLRGSDPLAEEVHVARDVLLAERTGGHVHILHVSSARSVELIRAARARGVRVTADVSPHHLTFTDEDVATSDYDTNFKTAPPLRSARDREALADGLADGTIDAIATGHAPQHRDDKEMEFGLARSGVTGLETAVGLVLDRLVHTGRLHLEQVILAMSTRPAQILGRPAPSLRVGAEADITVLDPARRWTVRAEDLVSKSHNTPLLGRTLVGAPAATVVAGRLVMEGGRLVGW